MAQKSGKNKQPKKGKKPLEDRAKKPTSQRLDLSGVVTRALPLACVAVAFVAAVLLFGRLKPPVVEPQEEPAPAAAADDPQVVASSSNVEEYDGVEDKWLSEGRFTVGNKELDAQVKEFCDALTTEGATARDNAQVVYNTIVWSTYEERTDDEKPSGTDWDLAAARHFFSTADPAQGKGGSGDTYEFAATTSFCLRYFGFSDAFAVPILRGSLATGQTGSALALFSDEYGQGCVCDPTLGADGWMLDRDLYNIVVEDIDQDLTKVEELGYYVQPNESEDMTAAPEQQYGEEQTSEDYTQDETSYEDYGSDYNGDEGYYDEDYYSQDEWY